MSYTNLNNPANYQLQSFGQDGMRTVSTTQPYVEGEYYRVIVAVEDSTISATSMVGDNLTNIDVYAGTTIYGLFTAITVSVGEVNAYLAGRTDIDDVWAYIRAYGIANGATIEAEQCAKDAIEPLLDKYYAQASLVMVPSLYKTSIVYSERPMTTDGQLTFTRNSNATRVNADGLVEKVRTNLITYSNDFSNAAWVNVNSTETGGQTGYDGSSDAWLIEKVASAGRITQSISVTGVNTASVYAKAGTLNWIVVVGGSGIETYYNLGTGVVGSSGPNVIAKKIESIGSGWYRCSFAFNGTGTSFSVYPADGNNDVGGTSGNVYIQDAQLEAGDIATDYIPTTSAAVSVGPVANLPRLNYPINSDGSVGCPSLLLEPQRTNLALYSEQFDNAAWAKSASNVTANDAISPDGYQSADKVFANATTNNHWIEKNGFTGFAIGTHTLSFYAKAGGSNFVQVATSTGFISTYQNFNLSNGTKGNGDASSAGYSTSIEAVGTEGWYRITFTAANPSTDARFLIVPILSDVAVRNPYFLGNGTDGIYLWGGQIEAGSYASSYIPTLGASVTRLADAASKTGISSLIGQTEGTFFVDFEYLDGQSGNNENWLALESDAGNDRVLFYKGSTVSQRILIQVNGSNVYQNSYLVAISAGTRYKLAVRYNSGDIAVYVNGSQIATDATTYTRTDNLNNITFNESAQPLSSRFNQMLVFPEGLTNAQLAELTTL